MIWFWKCESSHALHISIMLRWEWVCLHCTIFVFHAYLTILSHNLSLKVDFLFLDITVILYVHMYAERKIWLANLKIWYSVELLLTEAYSPSPGRILATGELWNRGTGVYRRISEIINHSAANRQTKPSELDRNI